MIGKSISSKIELRTKRLPVRTCIGCRSTGSKRDLIRIVRSSNGAQVDSTGKLSGRGAYVHAQRECWNRVFRGNQVSQALRMEIGWQDRQRLKDYVATLLGEEF